jgi:hypothetical protein
MGVSMMSLHRFRGGRLPVFLLLLWVPALALAVGCSSLFRRSESIDFVALGPEGVLRQAHESAGYIDSFRASGPLQLRLNGGSMAAQASVRYVEPDSFRIDVHAFLGTPVAQAVLRQTDLQLYLPSERTLYEGTITIASLFGLKEGPVDLGALRELFFGPALARRWQDQAVLVDRFDVTPQHVLVGVRRPGMGGQTLYELDSALRYRRVQYLDERDMVLWEADFSDYRRVGEGQVPTRVALRVPERQMELLFHATRRVADPASTPDEFTLRLPQGVARLPLHYLVPPAERPE